LVLSSSIVSETTTTHSGDDAAIIKAMANGDRGALAVLYDRYSSLLLAVGIKVMGERREAEDILHDVFLESWRQAGTFDPKRGTARTWLLLRMRSRCLDRKRSAGYSRSEPIEEAPDHSDDRAITDIDEAPDRRRVRQAVAALKGDQRAVVELSYFEGLSYSEIASRVGVPLGTIKSRMRLAVATLRSSFIETRQVSA